MLVRSGDAEFSDAEVLGLGVVGGAGWDFIRGRQGGWLVGYLGGPIYT